MSTYNIANNRIGTNAAGTAALGNVGRDSTRVGRERHGPEQRDLRQPGRGIQLTGFGPVWNIMCSGEPDRHRHHGPAPARQYRRRISLSTAIGNTIGGTGPGQGNMVAFNGGDGIDVSGGEQEPAHAELDLREHGAGIKLPREPVAPRRC